MCQPCSSHVLPLVPVTTDDWPVARAMIIVCASSEKFGKSPLVNFCVYLLVCLITN